MRPGREVSYRVGGEIEIITKYDIKCSPKNASRGKRELVAYLTYLPQ